MGVQSVHLDQYISQTPTLSVLPPWILRKTISHLLISHGYGVPPHREIICLELDPNCFAPRIDGIHGHLAYGNLGLFQLKKSLTVCRDQNQLGNDLNTLCDLLHDPEKAVEAVKLNILFQLRRLVDHNYFYVRLRAIEAIKIIAGQPNGRWRVVHHEKLMNRVICRLKDPKPCVRTMVYCLICVLSSYYLAVSKLQDYNLIKLIIEELKPYLKMEETLTEEGEIGETDNNGDEVSLEEEDVVENETMEDLTEIFEEKIQPGAEDCDDLIMDDKNIEALIILLETLINLMSFSRDATLDAICYDGLSLKAFLVHENRRVRLLTWNIFKQMFSTDIGLMALVPHDLLNEMTKPFERETDDEEFLEILATLMLALVNVENRVAAAQKGILDKVISLSTTKRLAVLNVLSHLAELPDARAKVKRYLPGIVGLADVKCDPTLERHLATLIERVLWTP